MRRPHSTTSHPHWAGLGLGREDGSGPGGTGRSGQWDPPLVPRRSWSVPRAVQVRARDRSRMDSTHRWPVCAGAGTLEPAGPSPTVTAARPPEPGPSPPQTAIHDPSHHSFALPPIKTEQRQSARLASVSAVQHNELSSDFKHSARQAKTRPSPLPTQVADDVTPGQKTPCLGLRWLGMRARLATCNSTETDIALVSSD